MDGIRIGLIALAGGAGAVARHAIGAAVGPRGFPWATLGINVVGSFALGLLVRAAVLRGWPDEATVPIGVGFLGAFTTFSTFSIETQALLRDGRTAAAGAYVGASVVAGVAMAAAGYALASARA